MSTQNYRWDFEMSLTEKTMQYEDLRLDHVVLTKKEIFRKIGIFTMFMQSDINYEIKSCAVRHKNRFIIMVQPILF